MPIRRAASLGKPSLTDVVICRRNGSHVTAFSREEFIFISENCENSNSLQNLGNKLWYKIRYTKAGIKPCFFVALPTKERFIF